MADTAEILRKAKALIEEPEKWLQGDWAQNEQGDLVNWNSDRGYVGACRFCMWAALNQITLDTEKSHELAAKIAGFAYPAKGAPWVDWNDSPRRTHAEVMAAFDKAIALAEQDRQQVGEGEG